MNNCPSRWTDLASAIQVTWTAPERPNGMLLRYHLQLTSYDGRRVITTERVGSSTLLGQLDNSELREYQLKNSVVSVYKEICTPSLHKHTPTPTGDGVPYTVSIFAENLAGNGTKCNVTDFTNELRTFH